MLVAAIAATIGIIYAGYCELPRAIIKENYHPAESGLSYILLAPYFTDSNYSAPGEVQLLNTRGDIVHTWKTKYQPLAAYLQTDGTLVITMTPPIDQMKEPGGGTTGLIQILDWDSSVKWEYADSEMNHDIEILADGSIAYTKWEKAPTAFANRVRGGFNQFPNIYTNGIVVVNRDKEIVWEWNMYEHFDAARYPLNAFTPRSDWAHLNSIRYIADNPITHTPAYLISIRHLNELALIDIETGDIIWESPVNTFGMQHDATLLENGNMLVFDNGMFKTWPRPGFLSSVTEFNPVTNKVVWTYEGGGTPIERTLFNSSIMGGAQRLANGNTLITQSTAGRIFVVTPEKKVVWDFRNDFYDESGHSRIVFKARNYSAEGTEWARKLPVNSRTKPLLCLM